MKHRVAGRRLDRTSQHLAAMLRNMATSLFQHERITTTTPKAKELKRYAEKVITLAKSGTPHARRLAFRQVRDTTVLQKLFDTIGPRFAKRAGGYTRIFKVGRRAGDNAELAIIELVERSEPASSPEVTAKTKKTGAKSVKVDENAEVPKPPKPNKPPKAAKVGAKPKSKSKAATKDEG